MTTNISYIFYSLSIAYQILVAYMAIKLVSITRSRAWILITLAAVFMIVRRILFFINILYFDLSALPHSEVFAMVGSLLMAIGMVLLVPVFIKMRRTDEALRESEKRYLDIYNNAPDMYFTVTPEGTVVSVNLLGAKMLGYRKEELISQSIMRVVHPDDVGSVQKQLSEILKEDEGVISSLKFRKVRKDGSVIHVSERASMQQLAGGERIIRIICRDISKLVEMEDELKERQLYLENIMSFAPDAIITQDKGGKILEWNSEAERLFGYRSEEAVGSDLDQLVASKDPKVYGKAREISAKLLSGVSFPSSETIRYHKDGNPINVLLSASPIRTAGQVVGAVAIYRDITKDKRLEREAEERRKYFESVVRSAPNAIVTTDSKHDVIEWNPEAERLFGYSRDEAMGNNIDDLITGKDPEVVKSAKSWTNQTLSERREVPPTRAVRFRKDGTPVDVIVSGSPILIGEKLIGVIATYTDLTQYKREERIRESIYRIAEAVVTTQDVDELFRFIHETINGLMPAENFYIAIYDSKTDLIRYPYLEDKYAKTPKQEKVGKGLTSYVLHTKKPLLATPRVISRLRREDELISEERLPISWLGVPLIFEDEVLGVIAVQSYTKGVKYTKRDREILQYVSSQIAQAVRYKQTEDRLLTQMRELRSFYSATLGRESKIIDLKHEVNRLLDRLDEKRRYKV